MNIKRRTMVEAMAEVKSAEERTYKCVNLEDFPKEILDEINEIMPYIYSGGIFSAAEAPTAWWVLEIQGLNLCCDPPTFAEGGLYQFYYQDGVNKYAIWRMNRPDHTKLFGHDIVDVYELDREEEEE